MQRMASCCCQQLQVTCQGEPVRVSICHCLECQRRTGSVFGTQARFHQEQIRVQGQQSLYSRRGDTDKEVVFHFCPQCGGTVYWKFPDMPEFTVVAVGAFADPDFPAPILSVYEDRRHAWATTAEGVIEEHWH